MSLWVGNLAVSLQVLFHIKIRQIAVTPCSKRSIKELIFSQGFNIYFNQYHCLSPAGAVKEIQIRIPEIVELYCLGSSSNVVHSAINLDKKRDEMSSGLPETNHAKSMAGNYTVCSREYLNLWFWSRHFPLPVS